MNPFFKIITKIFSKKVGEDEFGNQYFLSSRFNSQGKKKRIVIYKGIVEASKVPANWHSWLHYSIDDLSIISPINNHSWQKSHHPNLTGTSLAHNPLKYGGNQQKTRKKISADYQPWQPL